MWPWRPFTYSLSLQSVNADYKARLSNISNLVLVKFLEDTMVQPRDSEVGDSVAMSAFSKLYPAGSSRLVCSFFFFIITINHWLQWFGFYKEGQDKEVYTLFESKIWTEVRVCPSLPHPLGKDDSLSLSLFSFSLVSECGYFMWGVGCHSWCCGHSHSDPYMAIIL